MFFFNVKTNLNNDSNTAFAWVCFANKNEEGMLKSANRAAKRFDCVVQLIDAKNICSKQHIVNSVFLALKSFENKSNFSQNLGLEILLRASAGKNIKNAIEVMGVKNTQDTYVAVALGDSCREAVSFLLSDAVGSKEVAEKKPSQESTGHIMQVFDVSSAQISLIAQTKGFEERYNALCGLVLEKVALLDLER
ncbi:MAG: hypothetical protein J7K00_04520 [Candidatus Diapherotrites archaeon]|nr:hypothetical protein [Candidatus Diapherotrites archaeon]